MGEISYKEVSRVILDLQPDGWPVPAKLSRLRGNERFYEVRVLEGDQFNYMGALLGHSLRIQHHRVDASTLDRGSSAPNRCWGASVLIGGAQRLQLSYPSVALFQSNGLAAVDTAWLSVAEPDYIGNHGDLTLDDIYKSRGIGTYLLNHSVEWLSSKYPNAIVRPIQLTEMDAYAENKVRRNMLYSQFNIDIDFSGDSDEERAKQISGRSKFMLASSLVPLPDAVKGRFEVLTPDEYERRLNPPTEDLGKPRPQGLMDRLVGLFR